MGSLYRSEDMILCQMYLQASAAYSCVSQLGELGIVQFKDLNEGVNLFQRQFVSELRRCEEMERQLRYFEREMKKGDFVADEYRQFEESPGPRDIVDLEATFESMEADLKELNNGVETLERNLIELQELSYVLQYTNPFFTHGMTPYDVELSQYDTVAAADPNVAATMQLRYLAGVIPMQRLASFMRILWFASHGNIFVRHVEIPHPIQDPHTGDFVHKTVFLAVFQGDHLHNKVRKISEGFKATVYPCPEKMEERDEMAASLQVRIADLQTVLVKSKEQRNRTLQTIAHNLLMWMVKVMKLKAVYMVMNKFHNQGQNYIAECWLPYAEYGTVQSVLQRASELSGSHVSSLLHPVMTDTLPTYHRLNKFTRAFQAIIDAYGVASYKEVNPAAFSIITFPFLFSVMFGDAGHGLLMLLFALYLVLYERRLVSLAQQNEMFGIIFAGRYLILLMGFFSIYSGLIYNDIFSKSFNIFGSQWHVIYSNETLHKSGDLTLDASNTSVYHGVPYIFGIDPVWQLSSNKIMFTNSYKEKISVIFGVSQMLLGVILSICNHTYFRHYLDILTEFIPRLLFLMSIFGYLCSLIFVKWSLPPSYFKDYYHCAPNLLIGFINMFMMKYDDTEGNDCSNHTWYPGQMAIQTCLVIVAVVCAFWMLLSKPLVLLYRHKHQANNMQRLIDEPVPDSPADHHLIDVDTEQQLLSEASTDASELTITPDTPTPATGHAFTVPIPHQEAFDAGEVFIHQAIHTIEFCLGCISHTASYLRLWALSLAHGQLSEVLWIMVMCRPFKLGMNYIGGLFAVPVFAVFAVLTVVILLIMEGLSAFLHTLRLHWVEFNSKFYKGEGMLFDPFSFEEIMNRREQ